MIDDAMKITRQPEGYVLAVMPPYEGAEPARERVSRVMKTCADMGCQRLLMDARTSVRPVPALELFEMGEVIARGCAERGLKAASLASPGSPPRQRFLADVARHKGADFARFMDFDAAVEWLTEEES